MAITVRMCGLGVASAAVFHYCCYVPCSCCYSKLQVISNDLDIYSDNQNNKQQETNI